MTDQHWYLYIIRCGDNSLYTGVTVDVERRLAQHRSASGAKYLRSRQPLEVVYQIPAGNRSEALKLEYRIKRLTRAQKLALVSRQLSLPELINQMDPQ